MKKSFWISLLAVYSVSFGQQFKAKVLTVSGSPLPYVNVGIATSTIGTVTNEKGEFTLNLSNTQPEDTLRLSMIGYQSRSFLLKELNSTKSFTVVLQESAVELNEIVVTASKAKTKDLGIKRVSGFLQTGWGTGYLGGERGVKISTSSLYYLGEVRFHVAINNYDSVLLRLRIRKLENGEPDGDLEYLNENIFIVDKNPNKGWRVKDLNSYNITLNGPAAVTLELVKYWGKCTGGECFNISMAVPGKTFFAKITSFSDWIVKKGRSPSIYLTGWIDE